MGWRQRGELWELEPDSAIRARGLIEFIGGSYLAATPQLSYRRLLDALAARGWRIHAWSYVPGFDHQSQANDAWRQFRQARARGERRDSEHGAGQRSGGGGAGVGVGVGVGGSGAGPLLRLGHSLGCKLHLLAPDAGRGCHGLVALAFNNFSAERSVPLLAELGQQFNFRSEFSPSPEETLAAVARSYRQPRNLLVRFARDTLDQSRRLLAVLQARPGDASALQELPGDHLTPASAGLRQNLLGSWADDPARQRAVARLADLIDSQAG